MNRPHQCFEYHWAGGEAVQMGLRSIGLTIYMFKIFFFPAKWRMGFKGARGGGREVSEEWEAKWADSGTDVILGAGVA